MLLDTRLLSLIHSKFFTFLPLYLFTFFSFSISAQTTFIDIDENTQNRIMNKTVQSCDNYPNLNIAQSAIIKNNNQIPAFSLYQNIWDTLFIRSEMIEIPFYDNQLKIMLVQDGNTPFAFPVSGAVSTGFVKYKGKQHTGIDFAVQKREPVVACFDGVVRIAKKFEEYGNTVVIRHYNGLETLYALLDKVCVATGQKVNAGELVGYVVNNEQNKKNALHFETRLFNEFFNPEKVINFSERKLQSNLITLTPNDFIKVSVVKPNPIDNFEKTEEINSDENSSREQLLNTPNSLPVYHTVANGETIFKICTKYSITENQLRTLNNIKGDHIEVGQRLRVQ
ncbi:MAG: peptidoglycan DD-metalloendopeptidase family protein [Bacteroidales bacterium]|jgi:murein DD-endopeptidase MepM/ murein hydrolase activator NlpD|nr:peptidoglycan DD-metalloendopeptidase family protein [Bacteroidales bacterium]